MKQSEIKDLSAAELQGKLGELKKNYADLTSAHAFLQLRILYRSGPLGGLLQG